MKTTLFFLLLHGASALSPDSTTTPDTLPRTITTETLVVTGLRAGETTPATYVNVSKTDLQKNNLGQDLPILLDLTPSAVTTSDAGAGIGYTGIRIRGSDATRINVTLNGVPVNDAESQAVYWVNTPDIVSSVSSIQIQRGVGTSTNGSSAFGGQISLQTLAPSSAPYGEAGVSLGSFNTFRGTMRAGTGLLRPGIFADASASWIRSDGYIDRAFSNLRSWFAQAGYTNERSLVKFLYFGGREKTYQAWYGVPADSLRTNRTFNMAGTDFFSKWPPYPNETDNYGQDYFQLHWQQYWRSGWRSALTGFTTLGRGYYEQYKTQAEITNYFATLPSTTTDLVRRRWLRNVFSGCAFSVQKTVRKLDISLGGLGAYYYGEHFGNVVWTEVPLPVDKNSFYYYGKAGKTDFNVYAKADWAVAQKWHLYADFQYRFIHYQTRGDDNDGTVYDLKHTWHFVNPKAGVMYRLSPKSDFYASYALGHREPNRDDLLAAYVAQRSVNAERMHDIETGYKFRHARFPVNLNLYLMYYDNQLVLTGRLNDVGNPIKENVKQSYRSGVECSGSIIAITQTDNVSPETSTPKPILQFNYAFTWSINKIRRFEEVIYTYDENYVRIDSLTQIIPHTNTDISFSPSVIASLEAVVKPIEGFEMSLMNKYVSRQYLDNTMSKSRMLRAFYYSNLRFTYSLPLKRHDKEIKLTLLLNNLFNHLFESNGYTFSERYAYLDANNQLQLTDRYDYVYYYPQAGFNWLAGIHVRF
ncbi:MAG: TonB-dependent receptor [Chitinophagales bacterium]|nr:TonB-dependent receptor [Chitinophagales bacterium]MDW8419036.1 TonB-dependent receptor [Chitinophagales bacterium]